MNYSIIVKLPKSKTQQYDMPGPVSVNDLSDAEFIQLLALYNNHIQLFSNLYSLKKVGLKEVFWETLSPQKLSQIVNFYSSNPIYFADINTHPGENRTENWKDGIQRYKDISPKIEKSEQAYRNLGMNPLPTIRSNNKNYFIPNYAVNPLYKVNKSTPDPQIYREILQDLIRKNILQKPLSSTKYNDTKPAYYPINGVYYEVPHYNTLRYNDKYKLLLDVYNEFSTVEPIYLFSDNLEAWGSFLSSLLQEGIRSEKTYDTHIMLMPKELSPFKGTLKQEIPVFNYDDDKYYVPTYDTFRKNEQLFEFWKKIIIEGKTIYYSFADEAFRQLKKENPFQEIITDGLRFKAFYQCKKDPRWTKFINEKYLKIPENATKKQIEEMQEEIRTRSPRLFLFSSIKPIKKAINDEDGKIKHCFNLSNDYFEKIPDGEWKRCMSALPNDPCKIYEFVIWCETVENGQCVLWKGESRTPTAKGEIKTNYFDFLHDKGMNESAYSVDAALVDENDQIQYIIEFDGSDHFYSKRKDGNPTGKIVSDQVKNRFAREFNIPCVRIPGFDNKRNNNFINPFKRYIINIIRNKYNLPPLEQESETVKPAINQLAYKIRKMIK